MIKLLTMGKMTVNVYFGAITYMLCYVPILSGDIEMPKKKMKIRFLYNKPENYQSVFVNGVYGGITAKDDIDCHFFFEHGTLPIEQAFEVKEDGRLGRNLLKEEEIPSLTRDLKVGIVLKVEDAESIANWLLRKVKQVKGEKIGRK